MDWSRPDTIRYGGVAFTRGRLLLMVLLKPRGVCHGCALPVSTPISIARSDTHEPVPAAERPGSGDARRATAEPRAHVARAPRQPLVRRPRARRLTLASCVVPRRLVADDALLRPIPHHGTPFAPRPHAP